MPRGGRSACAAHDNRKTRVDDNELVHKPSSLYHKPPPLLALLDNEDGWKEWHYSFSRNGLTDFLPQFSDNLDCLVIGTEAGMAAEPASSARGVLPWQQKLDSGSSFSTITNLPVDNDEDGKRESSTTTNEPSLDHEEQIKKLVACTSASITNVSDNNFDCILDGGIMNAVISSLPSTVTWHSKSGPPALAELCELMQKANLAIREFGIYVAITETTIPTYGKEYLRAMGDVMGLEWTFDLDGLSNEKYSVSVARKYFTGAVNYDLDCQGDTDGKRLFAP